ncbi:MAG: SMP-30/gluconolactonase/LRE family protein [Anaerolineae bacterium]|nr:SMP-30/gluconolactonase/LRE family protein [Anaerolineae bacterium]
MEHFYAAQNELGEGPIWHADERALYWIDIPLGHVHRYHLPSRTAVRFEVGGPVGCLAMRAAGGFLIARQHDIAAWDTTQNNAVPQEIIRLEPEQVGDRFNDGAVDPRGRFWIGSMSSAGKGFLYRLDPDRSLHRMKTGIRVGNGTGWSLDQRTMYFTDSPRRVIYAYDYDPDTGDIENERVFAEINGSGEGFPDGLTVDRDGCVWSARWDGWKVVRYDPAGRIVAEFPAPVQRPTSCIFGGDDLDVLFITSACDGLSRDEQPLAGDVFCLETGTQGLPEPRFGG